MGVIADEEDVTVNLVTQEYRKKEHNLLHCVLYGNYSAQVCSRSYQHFTSIVPSTAVIIHTLPILIVVHYFLSKQQFNIILKQCPNNQLLIEFEHLKLRR